MKFSKRTSKFFNVATIVLELLCEIILLPFKNFFRKMIFFVDFFILIAYNTSTESKKALLFSLPVGLYSYLRDFFLYADE